MHTGTGRIDAISNQAGRAATITCAPGLIPAPGQYLLAHAYSEADAPLPTPVYAAASHATGFYAAAPLSVAWTPGTELKLRGPLGHGFHLPASARKVALVALGATCSRLLALIQPALTQNAAVALLTDLPVPAGLPLALEISPLSALTETARWADYLAADLPHALLSEQPELITQIANAGHSAEMLVETSLACGGMGECGICSVHTRKGHLLACKDGPVFEARMFLK